MSQPNIKIKKRQDQFNPTEKIPFGVLRTDQMVIMHYTHQKWQPPQIVPYQDLTIAPGAIGLHYGQQIFEGCKTFRHKDGKMYLFRPHKNADRFNHSAQILCMPTIPPKNQIQAMQSLIAAERLWYPNQDGACFYVRPFMIGTEDALGVRPSSTYTYAIILSPSGPYFKDGFNPISLLITPQFHRAAPGGSGTAKAGGNYAASLRAAQKAATLGAKQVLYLDVTNTYIEEAGAMNHFHVTNKGEIIIPIFTDSILRSITSESIIELAYQLGHPVRQENIKISDFIKGIKEKTIVEAGGLGTAAVVAPVNKYHIDRGNEKYDELIVGDGQIGPITQKMYKLLTDIQYGREKAPEGWLVEC